MYKHSARCAFVEACRGFSNLRRKLVVKNAGSFLWPGLVTAMLTVSGSAVAQSPIVIDASSLAKFSPRARADLAATIVGQWRLATSAKITSARRIEHFLAQLATETGGFRLIAENLNYSATRLREVFPSRVSEEQALILANKPIAIANHVYNGRLGNNPPMDGWNYRGSGLIQLTGRANFARVGEELGFPLEPHPDWVRQPTGAFQTAVAFWRARGINTVADTDDIQRVRKAVNGGTNGLNEARIWLARAKRYLRRGEGAFTDMNEELNAVADQLRALNFLKGDPGAFQTPDVKAGLEAFQHSRGLVPTGVLDEDTLYELTDPERFRTDN
jgi:predicted chitinase